MPTATRDRLMKTAHDLFYREGFRNVGLDRILADVGVTKTTFYNHFETKEDLVLAVLQWHDHWWRDEFVRLLRRLGGDSPRGQLLALPDALAEMLRSDTFNGCFFINVAVEFPLPHDPAHQAASRHKHAMEEIIRQLAGYAGAADPLALAQELSLLLEGAYVTLQISRRESTTEVVRRILNLCLDRHLLPERPARRASKSALPRRRIAGAKNQTRRPA